MFQCPMCKKPLAGDTVQCTRCRSDLTLLVHFMKNLDEHLDKAEAALKAGELGDAVWAYLNVLETDPDHDVARRQVQKVATAVRQFDEARRGGMRHMFLIGVGAALVAVILLFSAFGIGYAVGEGARPAANSSAP